MVVMMIISIIPMVIVIIVGITTIKVVMMSDVGRKFSGGYSMHLG